MVVLARKVRPEDWMPIGVHELEPNAMCVVRSAQNRSVIAGPGAGKTELLAQRAAYLLQTGLSPTPRRILAISFKRDAALNLGARVRKRCHRQHAGRFDSMTFDAFAKGLLDRFGQVLPKRWRPTPDYELMFPTHSRYRDFLQQWLPAPPKSVGSYDDIVALTAKRFERHFLFGSALPVDGWPEPSPGEWAADQYWQSSLHNDKKSNLSFPMISRLVELLLRLSPAARDALRLTYSHLFMDEFQDTTQIQYDLVRTIFLKADTIVTAVGDNKQQIMRWAMAMDNPFAAFDVDFKPTRTPLFNNYRSSPELVRIQHVLAKALDAKSVKPVSKTTRTVSGQSCVILDFSSPEREANKLAEIVSVQMKEHELKPRAFALLVRQKAADYASLLQPAFAAAGIPIRNESGQTGAIMLQDLLTEEASALLIRVLRLAATSRAGKHWKDCQEALGALRGVGPDDELDYSRFARELDRYATRLGRHYPTPPSAVRVARKLVEDVLGFIGCERLIAAHRAYSQGDWLEEVLASIAIHLAQSAEGSDDWTAALDAYEGLHAIPLMTIHKSKGLEYHTVIFVGLDDKAWWSFVADEFEGTAGFFVAFTRASQRVVFTYCARRGTRRAVAPLYGLLKQAGVKALNVE